MSKQVSLTMLKSTFNGGFGMPGRKVGEMAFQPQDKF